MNEPANNSKRQREILVVTHYFDPHGGGIERTARRLIDEIGGLDGFHFTWAASSGADDDEMPVGLSGQSVLPMKSYNFLERLCGVPLPIWGRQSLRRLREAIRQSDIVWLHDTAYMGNIAAFWMARKMKKPVMITQHIGTVPYRNPLLRWLMLLADRVFTQRMLSRAQQVVFISDWVAENYHRRVIFKTPVMIVPNGVDPEVYNPIPAEQRQKLRAQFALRDDQPVLLFAGRFVEKKGLAVIQRLAQQLPDWRFWLAGHGPIDPEHWYRPNVHVFRGRSGASLAELYRAADLFVLPSFGEGFPLVIQEAMACGLPVVCSPVTAAGSLLAKPFLLTATVDAASPERTSSIWLRRLKAQREFLPLAQSNEDLAQAAHYFWSWPKIAACYADILNQLVTGGG